MTDVNTATGADEIALAIGRITIGWNDLHLFLFSTFWQLNGGDAQRAKAIFFTIRTDRAQRDITAALIAEELSQSPQLQSAATNLVNEIGKLAGRRNDVLHAMWAIGHEDEPSVASVFPPSSPRLSKKDLRVELTNLEIDIKRLGLRASTISRQIREVRELKDRYAGHRLQPNAD